MGGIRKNFGQWLLAGLEIVSLAWPQCRCRPKSGWRPSPQLCSLKSAQEERAAVRDAARQDVHTLGGGRAVTHRHRQMQEGIYSCSCICIILANKMQILRLTLVNPCYNHYAVSVNMPQSRSNTRAGKPMICPITDIEKIRIFKNNAQFWTWPILKKTAKYSSVTWCICEQVV